MWNVISCYLSGQHDYRVQCEPGAIFLKCNHCGKRSMGWELRPEPQHVEARVPIPNRPSHVASHVALGR